VSRPGPIVQKALMVGALVLLLQVAVFMIHGVLDGRRGYRDEATAGIAAAWGGAQTLAGPMLVVPYTVQVKVEEQTQVGERWVRSQAIREVPGEAFFLPDTLDVSGSMECSERYRGVFRLPVYRTRLDVKAKFTATSDLLEARGATPDWSRAVLVVALGDSRGLRATPRYASAGVEGVFRPGRSREGWPGTIEADLPREDAGEFTVEFSLDLQGAPRLAVSPVGESNLVRLSGNWSDPSFDGASLPSWREIVDTGFQARWESTHFGRGFPQQWLEQDGRRPVDLATMQRAASGVTLADPVDAYRLVERSLKYALLVIVLIFAVFFLFELTCGRRVHPLQYALIGGALVLFYLGFLALGDFAESAVAYGMAALVSSALVTGYAWSVLKTGVRAVVVGCGLAATYGGLYVILRMQDFALLAGTAVLFALLAAIMWVTRRVDWYGESVGGDKSARG
jgi:inner membrane protein